MMGRINLGDEINPFIVEAASGRKVIKASLRWCDLLAIGSVLSFPLRKNTFSRRSSPIAVWGSGCISPTPIPPDAKFIFHSVRGPLTRCLVSASSDLSLGDPGLLVPHRWPSDGVKSYAWGIIPHHSQIGSPLVRALAEGTPRSVVLDFTDPDIDRTLAVLASCDRILSSSLHGLIFADAYGIPNGWLNAGEIHGGRSWKFYDYFASVGRSSFEPIDTSGGLRNLGLLPDDELWQADPRRINRLQDQIYSSFPRI